MNIQSININDKSTLENFKKFFQQQTLGQNKYNNFHVVMLFNTEFELGISNDDSKYINTANQYFTDGALALDYYANTKNPASQLITAKTLESLIKQMNQMIQNYNNQQWLNKNLLPYL